MLCSNAPQLHIYFHHLLILLSTNLQNASLLSFLPLYDEDPFPPVSNSMSLIFMFLLFCFFKILSNTFMYPANASLAQFMELSHQKLQANHS